MIVLRAAGPAAAVAGAEAEVVLGPREAYLFKFSNSLTERFPPGNQKDVEAQCVGTALPF